MTLIDWLIQSNLIQFNSDADNAVTAAAALHEKKKTKQRDSQLIIIVHLMFIINNMELFGKKREKELDDFADIEI